MDLQSTAVGGLETVEQGPGFRVQGPECWLGAAEDSGGEGEKGADEFENTADYDAYEAEGKEDQPDEGVEDDGDESGGPADDEEDEEEKQFHGGSDSLFRIIRTAP